MNTKTNKRFGAIHALVVTVALVLSILTFGLMIGGVGAASGEVTEPELEIVAANVEYAESLHLYYGVNALLPEGVKATDVKMMFFTDGELNYKDKALFDDAVADGAAYVKGYRMIDDLTVGSTKYDGAIVFNSLGVAAKNIVDDVYAVAFVEYDGETYYSEPLKYSVLQYVYDRRDDLKGNSSAEAKLQLKLYEDTLNYGAAAQTVLNYKPERPANGEFFTVKVVGGTLGAGSARALCLEGDKVKVKIGIDVPNAATAGIAYDGEIISSTSEDGYVTFTADKAGVYSVILTSTPVYVASGVNAVVDGNALASGLNYVDPGKVITLTSTQSAPTDYEVFFWDIGGLCTYEEPGETKTYTVPVSSKQVNIRAVYGSRDDVPGAGFENISDISEIAGADYGTKSGGYRFYMPSGYSRQNSAITTDPKNASNTVLHFSKVSKGKGLGIEFLADFEGEGKNYVIEFKLMMNSADNGGIIEIDVGSSYRLYLDNSNGKYTFRDYNSAGTNNIYGAEFDEGEWVTLRLEYYPEVVDEVVTMKTVFFINGNPVSISSNNYTKVEEEPDDLRFYLMQSYLADCYIDDIKCYCTDEGDVNSYSAMNYYNPQSAGGYGARFNNIIYLFPEYNIAENDPAYAESPYKNHLADLIAKTNDELFGEEVYTWLAGLYDSKTGGFYYSESARDNLGYLPDIESTAQSSGIMQSMVGVGIDTVLTAEQKALLGTWVQFSQSNQDGYFYHPQWGTNIGDSRRARDLGNYVGRLSYVGSEYLFKSAYARLEGKAENDGTAKVIEYVAPPTALTPNLGKSVVTLVSKVVLAADDVPDHLKSTNALEAYLNNLWGNTATASIGHSYGFGNTITSQNAQINRRGADYQKVVIDFLNARQKEAQELILANAVRLEALVGGTRSEAQIDAALKSKEGFTVDGLPTPIRYNGLWESGGVYFDGDSLYSSAANHHERVAVTIGGQAGYLIPTANYNFVSGLLKISGIYNSMVAEIPYATFAIDSAITMMKDPAENYKRLGESVVSVYNPPFAINNVFSNLDTFGDSATKKEYRDTLREETLEIFRITTEKIAVYKRSDGGFSYSPSASSSGSQGEPAAVPSSKESDVNGVALAKGAYEFIFSMLNIPKVAYLPTYEGCTEYDFGEGTVKTTHLEIFRYLIANGIKNEKVEESYDVDYDFEDGTLDGVTISGVNEGNLGKDIVEIVTEGNNKYLKMKDNDGWVDKNHPGSGLEVVFKRGVDATSKDLYYHFNANLKYYNVSSGVALQLYLGRLLVQFDYSGGVLRLQERDNAQADGGKDSIALSGLNINDWFNLDVKTYPEGKDDGNGGKYYATLTVTQNGNTVGTINYSKFAIGGAWSAGSYDGNARMFGLAGTTAGIYFDNVSYKRCGSLKSQIVDHSNPGDYYFDSNAEKTDPTGNGITLGTNGSITNTGNKETNGYFVPGTTGAALAAGQNTGAVVGKLGGKFSFNEVQLSLDLSGVTSGKGGSFTMKDSAGKAIALIEYTVTYTDPTDATVVFSVNKNTVLTLEKVDLSGFVDVRFEYHYGSSRLDAVARFKTSGTKPKSKDDATPVPVYYEAQATVVNGFKVYADGADATAFTTLAIEGAAEIKIVEAFVRNVKKP